MKAGTITAKIRDAVWVRLMEGETEKIRYRNIEMPLALKGLEIQDFSFDVPTDIGGKITFKLYFAEGVLPDEFPAPRPRGTRAEKAAAKAADLRESENATPFAEGASRNVTHLDPAEPKTITALMVMPTAETTEDTSEICAPALEKPKAKRSGKKKTA
jgi:hypothetical protein